LATDELKFDGEEEEEESEKPTKYALDRQRQPFGQKQDRFGDLGNKNPAPGFYNPRYEVCLPRVQSSIIKKQLKKSKKIKKFQEEQLRMQEERATLISAKINKSRLSANRSRLCNVGVDSAQKSDKNRLETEKVDENGEPLPYDDDNENLADESYEKLITDYNDSQFERSSMLNDAKGVNFRQMTGRNNAPQGDYLLASHPNPHESRFESGNLALSSHLPRLKGVLALNKMTSRDQSRKLKQFKADPNYDPNFDSTMKKVSSMPTFGKLLGRKEYIKPQYCVNEFREYGKGFELEKLYEMRKSPDFSQMLGRQRKNKRQVKPSY